jgi:hypothetical protein
MFRPVGAGFIGDGIGYKYFAPLGRRGHFIIHIDAAK